MMEFLSIREFNSSPKGTREKLERDGKLILTNNGKPMALVLQVDNSNLEETLETVKQIEDLRMLKSIRLRASERSFLSDEEIEQEIQASRKNRRKEIESDGLGS